MQKTTSLFLLTFATTSLAMEESKFTEHIRLLDWNSYFKIIAKIESNGDPKAHNKKENAIGILQIREGFLQDVNTFYRTTYRHEDCFNPTISKQIAKLYYLHYGKAYYNRTGMLPTLHTFARIHNGGYSQLLNNKQATDGYIEKYKKVLL